MTTNNLPLGTKILICEDVFLNFFVLQKLINKLYPELVIVHAIDGLEGVKQFESQQFDLVVTDIEMPNMDGWEFIKYIQQKGYNTSKIVVISAQTEQMLAEEAEKLSVTKYYSKPLTPEIVKEITDSIFVSKTEN
jgi:two-component system capsular synthesis sensor histidine kinase RcsC